MTGPTPDYTAPIAYRDAHRRLRRTRGRASEYPCAAECGEQAQQWALRHDVPAQQSGPVQLPGRSRPYQLEWSGDPSDYDPMCRKCHRAMDAEHKPRQVDPLCKNGHAKAVWSKPGDSTCNLCVLESRRKPVSGTGHPCPTCGAKFSTPQGMKTHVRQIHATATQ